MEEKPKINPQPGDIAIGPIVKSKKRTTPRGNIEIKVPEGALPEGFDIDNVVPILVNRAIEATEIIESEVVEEPVKADVTTEETLIQETPTKKEDNDKKPAIVGCLPIALITVALATSIGSCTGIRFNDTYIREVVVREETPISMEYIEANGPQDNTSGVIGEVGQEQMTNRDIDGGEHYSAEEHYEKEKASVEGLDEYREHQAKEREILDSLSDDSLSQDEIHDKIETLVTETEAMKQQYDDKEDLIDEGVEEFKEATMVYEDDHSENEIAAVEEMQAQFDREQAHVGASLDATDELLQKAENGEKIEIDSIENDEDDGKYTITGQAIKEVTELQEYHGIRASWERFKDAIKSFFKGKPNQNKNNNNIER